jgi:hypothetical protein
MQCVKNTLFCTCSVQGFSSKTFNIYNLCIILIFPRKKIISKFHLMQRGEFRLLLLHYPARLHPPTQTAFHDFVLPLIFWKRNFVQSKLQKNLGKFCFSLIPKSCNIRISLSCLRHKYNKCPENVPLSTHVRVLESDL